MCSCAKWPTDSFEAPVSVKDVFKDEGALLRVLAEEVASSVVAMLPALDKLPRLSALACCVSRSLVVDAGLDDSCGRFVSELGFLL